jgi:hypothetical protein
MATHTIFYSWQSDLPNSINRGFIEDCLRRAIKDVKADEALELDPCLDRDTAGVPGSPDIANTIFEKISRADIFVADVSFINGEASGRRTPNPNVLIELGYAAHCLGWDRLVCVFNRATGEINDLPFDIRQRRVRGYELSEGQEKGDQRKLLVSVLKGDIADILHAPDKVEAAQLQELLAALAPELIEVIIAGDELEERSINPWLDAMLSGFSRRAGVLRDAATTDVAIRNGMQPDLDSLADTLDEAANLTLHFENWDQLEALVQRAVQQATALKHTRIDCLRLDDASLERVRTTLVTTQRKLAGLAARATDMADRGCLDDLMEEPSSLGHALLRVGHFQIDRMKPGLGAAVRRLGRELHLIETMRIVCDGGVSVQAVVGRIRSASEGLTQLVGQLAEDS